MRSFPRCSKVASESHEAVTNERISCPDGFVGVFSTGVAAKAAGTTKRASKHSFIGSFLTRSILSRILTLIHFRPLLFERHVAFVPLANHLMIGGRDAPLDRHAEFLCFEDLLEV